MHNQTLKVLERLRQQPITRFHAIDMGVLNITARISDLRNEGYEIFCEMLSHEQHNHGATKFGRWHLVSEPKEIK